MSNEEEMFDGKETSDDKDGMSNADNEMGNVDDDISNAECKESNVNEGGERQRIAARGQKVERYA